MVEYVCDIEIVLKFRLILGYYYDCVTSTYKKCLLKGYSIIINILFLLLIWNCDSAMGISFIEVSRILDLIFLKMCSYLTNDKYLIDYFIINNRIDDTKEEFKLYRYLSRLIIAYIIVTITFCFGFCLILVIFMDLRCYRPWLSFFSWINHLCKYIGYLPIFMIFGLFYCRLVIFVKNVRRDISRKTEVQYKDHLKKWDELLKTLQKTDKPLKFMILWSLVICFQTISNMTYNTLQSGSKMSFLLTMEIVFIVCSFCIIFSPIIILELIGDKMDKLQSYIADRILTCAEMEQRDGLRQLLQGLRQKPLIYSLWNVMTLNSNLPLSFISLTATYTVCLLQFSKVNTESLSLVTSNSTTV